ncbi:hypothetical protein KEM54_005270 [Ascosphaera aggregata]|nr:hypothetical protein KEM54_005270 [Ascosphaera aggregata]
MISMGAIPAGTFMPGTKVQVGSHRVIVERYLSEGGFAHVYVVRLPSPIGGTDLAVLKRVAVPNKAALANMRTEVETMKKLRGHRHIVTYIDSHASQLKGGGYEVFLLMEFCAGGGLIDFMNTRLQNRLTEPEILKIFTDVAEGVACMHYLKPALLHRDLKVENVLIAINPVNQSFCYKLCDFGSAAPPRPAATNAAEGIIIEDDVQRHTTMQYRSPEMVDVYRGHPIDEKSDIWALGVFLYKLCYYITPFEEAGQIAILNASFKFPAYPQFSDRLKLLIAEMLQENPQRRPNIYQVLKESCYMRGKECPIPDCEPRLVAETVAASPSPVLSRGATPGANFTPPIQETPIVPEITPMRRGRPAKPVPSTQPAASIPHASHSPFRYDAQSTPAAPVPKPSPDPFSALDQERRNDVSEDELSMKYPTLEELSSYHDKGPKFRYEGVNQATQQRVPQHVAQAFADEAFARHELPTSAQQSGKEQSTLAVPLSTSNKTPATLITRGLSKSSSDLRREVVNLTKQTTTHITSRTPSPVRSPVIEDRSSRPVMVSTGTMTSPPPTLVNSLEQPEAQGHKKTVPISRPDSSGHSKGQGPQLGQSLPRWPPSQDSRSLPSENSPTRADERAQLSSGELPPRPHSKHGVEKEHHNDRSSGNGSSDSRRTSREFHRPGFFSRMGSRSSKHHPSTHGNAAKVVDYEKEEATTPAMNARASLDMSRPSIDADAAASGGKSRQRVTSMFLSARDQLNEDHPRASLDSSLSRPSRHGIDSAYVAASITPAADYNGGERLHLTRSESGQLGKISSDVDYLRAREEDAKGRHSTHIGKGHKKKGSLAGLSFSGTKKSLMSGRFGDAFRMFEASNGKSRPASRDGGPGSEPDYTANESTTVPTMGVNMRRGMPALSTIPSPDAQSTDFPRQPIPQRSQTQQHEKFQQRPKQQELQEGTIDLDRLNDDDLEQLTDDSSLSPEVRREIERRRALLEEKRVAAAAAEYRRRFDRNQPASFQGSNAAGLPRRYSGLPAGATNTKVIQNKVQSLLCNENRRPPPKKTATGYGKYTDVDSGMERTNGSDSSDDGEEQAADTRVSQFNKAHPDRPATQAKPVNLKKEGWSENPPTKPLRPSAMPVGEQSSRAGSVTGPLREQFDSSAVPQLRAVASMQPRSQLRSIDGSPTETVPPQFPMQTASSVKPVAPPKPKLLRGGQQLSATRADQGQQRLLEEEPGSPDWEAKFNQKYPSLSGLEMADAEVEVRNRKTIGTKQG